MNEPNLPAPRPDNQWLGPLEDEASPRPPFQVRRLLAFLLKFWWVPILIAIISLGAAFAYVWYRPPTFVSTGRMWETVKVRLPEGAVFTEDVQNFLGTQTELLQSETLRLLTLAQLRSGTNNIPRGKEGEPMWVDIRVAGAAKSSVFRIESTSSDAAYARAYLDALMNVFLEYKKDIRKVVSGDTLASISEQVGRAERELQAEQDVLTAFQRTNNLAILEEEGRTAGGYLARLRTQLSDLQLEHRLLQLAVSNQSAAVTAETNAGPDLVGPLAGPSLSAGAPPEYQLAVKELELLKMQRAKLSRFLRPKHPKIVKLDAELERNNKLIELYRRQFQDQLAASLQAIQMKIENVLLSIREWETKVVQANSRIAEAERLQRNVQRFQGEYDRLILLLRNVGLSRNIDQETLAILEPASEAKRSYKQEIGVLALALLGGSGLGFGLVFLIAVRDDRFASVLEVNEKFGDAIVGQVPEVTGLKRNAPVPLLGFDDERHMYAEAYRNLRSALFFLPAEPERPRLLLITSAVPNEGKSTIAANLARTLALGGSRVLLVDADLRKGRLHELMGLPREPGLSELLRQPGDLNQFIRKNSLPNLSFLSRGGSVHNPGDLFLSQEFDQVLKRLRQQFDYVLLDSSPIFAADDATTLGPKVDGTLFVVRSRFSRAGPVKEALELLLHRQARVLGLVFNRADASARSYYYYKHADYYRPPKSE